MKTKIIIVKLNFDKYVDWIANEYHAIHQTFAQNAINDIPELKEWYYPDSDNLGSDMTHLIAVNTDIRDITEDKEEQISLIRNCNSTIYGYKQNARALLNAYCDKFCELWCRDEKSYSNIDISRVITQLFEIMTSDHIDERSAYMFNIDTVDDNSSELFDSIISEFSND